MAVKVNWTLNVEVSEGPKAFQSETIEAEAYGKVAVDIAATETKDVEVQPSDIGKVDFLLITSSAYGSSLTYQLYNVDVTPEALAGPVILLDGPHLLVGNGAVKLLTYDPVKLRVTNGLTEDVTVEILVARDAATLVTP